LLANFPFRPAHLDAACTVFPARLALDASAGQDVARPSAGRFQVPFPALVRDFRLALAAQARPDAPLAHSVPQRQAAPQKVVFPAP
jgi:hypothetical protein